MINAKIPFVRELCLKYENIDPVTELIPVRPVVHYMMGGVHTDINGATPLAGLYAAGEVACVSINGANRLGLELAAGAARLRRARRHGRRRVRGEPHRRASCRHRRAGGGRGAPAAGCLPRRAGQARADGADPRRDAEGDGRRRRHLPHRRRRSASGRDDAARRCRSDSANVAIDDHSRTFNTELIAAARARRSCSTWPRPSPAPPSGARNRAARTSAPTSPAATTSKYPGALAGRDETRTVVDGRVPAGDDHPVAARGAGLREVGPHGGSRSRCRSPATGRKSRRPRRSRSTRSRSARTGSSSTRSTTSRTASTGRCRSAGRAAWASAAAAA